MPASRDTGSEVQRPPISKYPKHPVRRISRSASRMHERVS